jgi:hypothetical protein
LPVAVTKLLEQAVAVIAEHCIFLCPALQAVRQNERRNIRVIPVFERYIVKSHVRRPVEILYDPLGRNSLALVPDALSTRYAYSILRTFFFFRIYTIYL